MKNHCRQCPADFQHGSWSLYLLLMAFLSVFLQSCTSSPPHFYELGWDAAPPEKVKDSSLPVLYIPEPFLPLYINRPQIVIREDEKELVVKDMHRWVAPLGELIGERLSTALNQQLAHVRVVSGERALLHPKTPMRLEVNILDFISDNNGTSRLTGTYLLWREEDAGREIPFRIITRFRGNRMESRVASLGEAVDVLCRQIGDSLTIYIGEKNEE